jgi:hypothetical protein
MLGKTGEREGKTGQQRCPENPSRDVFSLPHAVACSSLLFGLRYFLTSLYELIAAAQKSLSVHYDQNSCAVRSSAVSAGLRIRHNVMLHFQIIEQFEIGINFVILVQGL